MTKAAHPNQLRSPPADLAQMAASMTVTELSRHYVCGDATLKRWIRETGVRPVPRAALPTPTDFAANAKTMHGMALTRHYGVSQSVINRWVEKAGVKLVRFTPPAKERAEPKERPVKRAQPQQFIWTGKRAPRVPDRDTTLSGRAAEHLRRFTPVYRCHERGAADPKGSHWRYGNAVLTEDEMFQRARRHGWEAVA